MFAASVHNVSAFVKCAFVFLHLFVILFVASLCVENCLSTDWVSVRYYDAEIFLTLVLRFVPECKWMLVICQWHASHASDMRVTCEWHASDTFSMWNWKMSEEVGPLASVLSSLGQIMLLQRRLTALLRRCGHGNIWQLSSRDMSWHVVTCRDIWHLHLFIRKFEFRCRTVDLSPKIETKTTQSHSVFVAMEQECDLQLPMCPFHLLLVALSNFATTCSDVYLLFSFITCNFAR